MLRKRTLGNSKKYTYTVYSNCNGATVNFNNSPVGVISGGKFIYTTSVNSTYDVSLSNVSLPGSYTYTSERSGSGSDYSYGTYSPSTYSVELTLNPDTGKLRIVVNFDSAPRYFDVHYSTPYTCTFVDTHEVSYTSPGTGRVSADGQVTINYGTSDNVISTDTTNKVSGTRVETGRDERTITSVMGAGGGWFRISGKLYDYSSSYYHDISKSTSAIYIDETLTGSFDRDQGGGDDATNYHVYLSKGDMTYATPTKSWETVKTSTSI